MTVTTTVPATRRRRRRRTQAVHAHPGAGHRADGRALSVDPTLTLRWQQGGTVLAWPFSAVTPIRPSARSRSGVWGPPQDADAPKVPKGEVVQALSQVQLTARGRRLRRRAADRLQPARPVRPAPAAAVPAQPRAGPHRDAQRRPRRSPAWSAAAAADGDAVLLADSWRRRCRRVGARAGGLARTSGARRPAARLAGRPAGAAPTLPSCPTVGRPGRRADGRRVRPPAGGPRPARRRDAARGCAHGGGTTVSDRPRAERVAPPTVAGLTQRPRGGAAGRRRRRCRRGSAALGHPDGRPGGHPRGPGRRCRGHPARRPRSRPARRHHRRHGGQRTDGAPAARTVRAGEVAVLALPNAHRDVDGTGERPALAVAGLPGPGRRAAPRRRRAARPDWSPTPRP